MNDRQSSRVNQILDLLVEEIEERLRVSEQPAPPDVPLIEMPAAQEKAPPKPQEVVAKRHPPDPGPEFADEPPGSLHADRLMGRLALGLLIVIVLVNIPLNRHGTTLSTALPDNAALVVQDGLVVKEENDERIYVYQDDHFRWISSMDAFEHFFNWGDVHIVEDGYLDRFEIGTPLHVLIECNSSHIYRLEGGEKRWIRDIDTFVAEGHVWEDVRFVSCGYLRGLPDGETIPPDSGPPPQP